MLIDKDKLKENIKNQLKGFVLNSLDVKKSVKDCLKLVAKAINEQPSEFEWISVEDKLPTPSEFDPDYSDNVIVLDSDGDYYLANYWYYEAGFSNFSGDCITNVIKWTYFPQPEIEEPEKVEDEFNSTIDRVVFECIWNRYFGDNIGREEDYKNDTFECRVYCWNEEVWNNEYHFWHKPTEYKLRWYKYPLRGAEANMDLTPRQFLEILVDCQNSVYKDQGIKMEDKTVGKWWEAENDGE